MYMDKAIMPKKWSGVYATSLEQNNSLRGCGVFHAYTSEKKLLRILEWLFGEQDKKAVGLKTTYPVASSFSPCSSVCGQYLLPVKLQGPNVVGDTKQKLHPLGQATKESSQKLQQVSISSKNIT